MWRSLLKLEFLKNDKNKVGLVRLVTFLTFLVFWASLLIEIITSKESGFPTLPINWIILLSILLILVIGEKAYTFAKDLLRIWKGKETSE